VTELLAVQGLQIRYHSERGMVHALDGVSLTVAKGEVVGVVGESGCGKSTLVRAILGVLPKPAAELSGGSIRFAGRDLAGVEAIECSRSILGRRITFVPQDPFASFNPLFTIGQQMLDVMHWKSPNAPPQRARLWPCVLARYPRAQRRRDHAAIVEMLHALQIQHPEQTLHKFPHELSGGQRQRIMIAMALLPEPDLIIADEPTTALDVTIQAQILRLLYRQVKGRGVSLLFTTHDLGAAYEICDRIIVMYAGQEVEAAPNAAFFAAPRHPYTAKLLESLPRADAEVNEIRGEIPSLIDPPPGCRFHTRCDFATADCSMARPSVSGGQHSVRCYHPL
jgi:peptide/nickel transport system ATP-binding protein